MNSSSALQNPLDRLADEIHELLDAEREDSRRAAFHEVLGLIESLKREQEEIAAEHVPGRVYGTKGA